MYLFSDWYGGGDCYGSGGGGGCYGGGCGSDCYGDCLGGLDCKNGGLYVRDSCVDYGCDRDSSWGSDCYVGGDWYVSVGGGVLWYEGSIWDWLGFYDWFSGGFCGYDDCYWEDCLYVWWDLCFVVWMIFDKVSGNEEEEKVFWFFWLDVVLYRGWRGVICFEC